MIKRKDKKVHEKERETAGIYTNKPIKNRRQSGEASNEKDALPETITPNPNGRTPCLNGSRQTRAGRERDKSRPARRLIVYYDLLSSADLNDAVFFIDIG